MRNNYWDMTAASAFQTKSDYKIKTKPLCEKQNKKVDLLIV